ncbi:TraR/DksA C4-type zinc finger protein [Dasania marina]|uniref:TraR/DksA C4-type zinc finger protein n=1 Tax=Dasania marina TaxID=471499 RepID=UPI000376F84B|nr:TraR/DksA C4-type zinc finger protein [Dasania marina]
MADEADKAADLHAALNDSAVQNILAQTSFNQPSHSLCIDCDDDIPDQRRAYGGITRCVDCQSIFDEIGSP